MKKPYYIEVSREYSGRNGILVDPWWKTCSVTHVGRSVNGAVVIYQRLHALTSRPED